MLEDKWKWLWKQKCTSLEQETSSKEQHITSLAQDYELTATIPKGKLVNGNLQVEIHQGFVLYKKKHVMKNKGTQDLDEMGIEYKRVMWNSSCQVKTFDPGGGHLENDPQETEDHVENNGSQLYVKGLAEPGLNYWNLKGKQIKISKIWILLFCINNKFVF